MFSKNTQGNFHTTFPASLFVESKPFSEKKITKLSYVFAIKKVLNEVLHLLFFTVSIYVQKNLFENRIRDKIETVGKFTLLLKAFKTLNGKFLLVSFFGSEK